VLGEPRRCRGGQLGLLRDAVRAGDRTAGGSRLERDALEAVDPRDENRRLVQDRGAADAAARRADAHAAGDRPRDRGPRDQRPRPQQDDLPAVERRELVQDAAGEQPLVRPQLDDDVLQLRLRPEEIAVDAGREDAVVAGEALLGGRAGLVRERDERVDAAEQPLALRAGRRIREPVAGDEGRDGQRVRVAEGEVRERGEARLEAVHDVVAALGEGLREVGLDADRHPHLRAPRDRDRRADRDHLGLLAAGERPAPGQQVGGARGRCEHRHLVAQRPQPGGDACHVLVHVVGLRPGEGRDQTDPHTRRVIGARHQEVPGTGGLARPRPGRGRSPSGGCAR